MFQITESFRSALQLANGLPEDRFPLLLERIIAKAHLKSEAPFSEAESRKLEKILGLSSTELGAFLGACTCTVEQAATGNVSDAALGAFLAETGLVHSKVAAFQHVWRSKGQGLVHKLRELPLEACGQCQVAAVDWRVHLQVADSETGPLLEPVGSLQLQLQPLSQVGGPGGTRRCKKIAMEFTYDELCAYFEKLEQIQAELDALS